MDCSPSWADSSANHPKNAALNALIDDYIQKGLPGIAVYTKDASGAWVGSAGKADGVENSAYQPCHIQKVASLTKMFMGALVFKLMEDSSNSKLGYNDLDKPISTWIPSSQLEKIPNTDQITLRQCLNHSSGLFDVIKDNGFYLEVLNDPTKHWSANDLLSYVKKKDSEFAPGTKYSYSNTNDKSRVRVGLFSLPEQPETRKMRKYKNPKLSETQNQNLWVPDKYFKLVFFGNFETFLSF